MRPSSSSIRPLLTAALLLLFAACSAEPVAAPDLIQWKVEQARTLLKADEANEHIVTIDIQVAPPPEAKERRPVDLSVVLDHSGSMTAEQLQDARSGVYTLLAQLQDDDTLSVVAFSSRSEVLLPQTAWDEVDQDALRARIDALRPQGTTAMQEGLQQGYNEIRSLTEPGRIRRVILFSDGVPNDPTYLEGLANEARANDVAITTMGLGPYYNEDLMTRLADASGGRYHFIERSEQLTEVFRAEIQAVDQLTARNVVLTLTPGPNVEIRQVLGGVPSPNGRRVSLYLGDLAIQEVRQIALKLNVQAPRTGAPIEILDAQLAWDDVATEERRERWAYLEAESTNNLALLEEGHDKLAEERAARLFAAAEIDNALRDYREGNYERAVETLNSTSSNYRRTRQAAETWAAANHVVMPQPLAADPSKPASGLAAGSGGGATLDRVIDQTVEELNKNEPESAETLNNIKATRTRARYEFIR